MDTKNIERMLKKQANMLYAKGVAANQYHKVILPIIFVKFLTSKIENDWNKFMVQEKISDNKENYKKYLNRCAFNSNWIAIDYEYLWTKILKTSFDEIKLKLDGVFNSIGKYEKKYKNMSVNSFSSSNLLSSYILKQVEFIENNYPKYSESESIDLFGYIYEYFLEKYNVKQGRGGEFYTPHTIVKLMVNITESRIKDLKKNIKIYDPTMGSGGMLTQSLSFLSKKWKDVSNVSFFGQEILRDTWNMSRMNFLLRSQAWNFGDKEDDVFLNDKFSDEKFEIILSNPPFNANFSRDEYLQLETDERFSQYGIVFGSKKANFNFFNHIISHLADDGIAAVLMSPPVGQINGSKTEVKIRKKYVEKNIIEAIISLPQGIFQKTNIGAHIWVFNKNKSNEEILFIDLLNKTIKKNKLQILEDKTIKSIVNLFKDFCDNKKQNEIKTDIPFAIVSNERILQDPNASLNINEHIIIKEKRKIISKKEIALQLKNLKDGVNKTFEEIEETINYLSKL